jgi:signal transduction histidine kinase
MNHTDLVLAIIITTLLILLLIGGVTISFFIVGRQRAKQQIELSHARLQYEQELRQVETEVTEHLMQQVGQELHDNIGHLLTCIRLEIENKKLDSPMLVETLHPMETYLDDASAQLRLLSRSLNTEYLSGSGLSNAIHTEVERLRYLKKFNIHCEVKYTEASLDRNQELMVFRIFQEIMTNAIKHSKAKNVYIALTCQPNFDLTIKDDGKGFPVEEILQSPKASGLKNVLRRANMAGIFCQIHSLPGEGCSYEISKQTPRTQA